MKLVVSQHYSWTFQTATGLKAGRSVGQIQNLTVPGVAAAESLSCLAALRQKVPFPAGLGNIQMGCSRCLAGFGVAGLGG